MNEADKVTAELMALANLFAEHCVGLTRCKPETKQYDDCLGACNKAWAELEQAIRRAVEWGEPVAFKYQFEGWLADNWGLAWNEEYETKRLETAIKVPLYARNKP